MAIIITMQKFLQPVRSEFMLKFLFSNLIPVEKVIEILDNYKKKQEEELNKYKNFENELETDVPEISPERKRFLKATIRRVILTSQASIKWCEETIREFKK